MVHFTGKILHHPFINKRKRKKQINRRERESLSDYLKYQAALVITIIITVFYFS